MTGRVVIREAQPDDLREIVRHRRAMFEEMGFRDQGSIVAMMATAEPALRAAIREGSYRGWLAETLERGVVGGGGVYLTPSLGHPLDPGPRRATVLNMYTALDYRRRGVAREIMRAILAWCEGAGFRSVTLHASDAGRALYAALGFEPTNEMGLRFKR